MPPTSLAGQAVDTPPATLHIVDTPRIRRASSKLLHHFQKHVGVGIICAVAYFDPGNWSVDLQAGATFGYRPMLFVILLAGIGAVVFQSMACRLGCVTGLDLAAHCRLLLYNRPKYKLLYRYGLLYPLYALCEIAIISTDLAELLGSGIGLVLLFPSMPLWAAMLVTAADVVVFLLIGDPSRGGARPARIFEFTVIALVGGVVICFIILLVHVNANWGEVFLGFIPSEKLFQGSPNAVYTAVGIMGATVMPHALFLGSYLATQDRVSAPDEPIPLPTMAKTKQARLTTYLRSLVTATRSERIAADRQHRNLFARPENNTFNFVKAHLGHGLFDIVSSLLCVAVPINSAILIISATVFFQEPTGESGESDTDSVGLFNAYYLIQSRIGQAPATLFAIALLCAGQTSSITATLAGQIVSEGFIQWRISPVTRRLLTRLLGLIPALVVASALGKQGIEVLMVVSQVVLSIVLPFVVFPLIFLTTSASIMSVEKPRSPSQDEMKIATVVTPDISEKLQGGPEPEPLPSITFSVADSSSIAPVESNFSLDIEEVCRVDEGDRQGGSLTKDLSLHNCVGGGMRSSEMDSVDFSNGRIVTSLAYLFWAVVIVANAYALVELALGNVDTS